MHAFWQKGFEASSVKALSEQLGITRSSFYNAFSSREALFHQAVERYITAPANSALYTIEQDVAFKPAVVQTFRQLCATRANDAEHRGCLLVNSVAEFNASDHHSDLAAFLDEIVHSSRNLLSARIEIAIGAGEFPETTQAGTLALALQNLSFGTNLMSKVIHDEDALWASCALTLEGLGF